MELKKRPYQHSAIKQPTWQNPFIEYFEMKSKKISKKPRRKAPRRVRLEHQILAMLACFSVSAGLWENFRQLWLQQNNFSVTDVSNVLSFGMLLSVVGVLLVGKAVKMPRLKQFMTTTLFLRSVNVFILRLLDGTGHQTLISICSMLDVVSAGLIVASVYPLLTTIMKSNNVYSKRKLVEYLFRDVGILIGGVLIGRMIGLVMIDYNACLLISGGFSVAASIIMGNMEINLTERAPLDRKFSAVKYVMSDRIQRVYMTYAFLSASAYNAVIGLRMLMLTDYFNLSASMATNYLLIVGLASDVLGIVALRYFTPKNDYITMTIKFGIRLGIFLLAFATGDTFLCFISLTWTLLSSTAYENISDGYYINSVDNRYQLKYNTLKHVVSYAGEAFGVFLCGQMFQLGLEYIFGLSAVMIILQLTAAFRLIYLREHYGLRLPKSTSRKSTKSLKTIKTIKKVVALPKNRAIIKS